MPPALYINYLKNPGWITTVLGFEYSESIVDSNFLANKFFVERFEILGIQLELCI